MSTLPSYVVITPARNEAKFIELTIQSVAAQTLRPLKWIIVSDGSTDGTDEIVGRYAAKFPWIELLRMPERSERNFAGKVHAFNAGYELLRDLQYDVIASLDADITFGEDYFAYLLDKLATDSTLGLVGTPFKEGANSIYDYRFVNIEHVSGACQVFRRMCFEEIGGYVPVKAGCIDHIAVLSARMNGWKTRTFTDRICLHHRDMGTAQQNMLAARFKNGRKDYSIGNHPLWEFSRVLYQMSKRPIIIGGAMLACGYGWAMIRREPRPVSAEMMAFVRREQMQRLRKFVVKLPVSKKQESAAKATSACS
jgi:biofilm PGA synthesis N-glycosyltransferase PgaC